MTAAKGNALATNLDRVLAATKPHALFDAIKTPAHLMPDFCFKENDIKGLVNAILAEATGAEQERGDIPLVIHFEDQEETEGSIFGKHCGSCHKALTTRFGGLGKGDIGPNLSGLFSEHYPRTGNNKKLWSSKFLKEWLQNPRQISKDAQMPPVTLPSGGFRRLLEILGAPAFSMNNKGPGKNGG